MLKGQSYSSIVKKNNSWAIQIDHLNKSPSSIQTRIDPGFVDMLETKNRNPSLNYQNQMKSLLKDGLDGCLREQADMLRQKQKDSDVSQKDYRSRVDGVLYQLQKNSLTYNLALNRKMNRQQERKRMFVDQDKMKNSKIQHFVQKRQDKNVFNHQSDLYQQYQQQESQNTQDILRMQRREKIMQNQQRERERRQEVERRHIFEKSMEIQKLQMIRDRQEAQKRYGQQLITLVKEKRCRDSLDQSLVEQGNRHNPITNPIEFHIQNPYLLRRMQDRYRSS